MNSLFFESTSMNEDANVNSANLQPIVFLPGGPTQTSNTCISWDTTLIGHYQVLKDDPPVLLSIVWCSGAIGVLVVCMNFIVIFSIMRTRNLRQNSVYIFVFSLAIADLLAAVIFVFTFLRFHLTHLSDVSTSGSGNKTNPVVYDVLKENNHKLYQYLIELMLVTTCFTASIGSLALTAIDRFIAVVKPFDYYVISTRRRCVISIVVMWIISATISSLPVVGWRCNFECNGLPPNGCSQLYPGISKGYLTFYVSLVVSLLLMVIGLYVYIFTIVWRHCEGVPSKESLKARSNRYPSSTWPRTRNAAVKCNLQTRERHDHTNGRKLTKQNDESSSNSSNCSNTNSGLFELQRVDAESLSIGGRRKSKCYELRKESFRFVLVVDEQPDGGGEREKGTSFRGLFFYGNSSQKTLGRDSRPSWPRQGRISYVSPPVVRRRTNKRIDFQRNKNQMQIIQTLIFILGLLILCWVPSLVFMLLDLVMEINKEMKKAFAFFALLTLLNSAANPVIYAIRLRELRSMAKKVLCKKKRSRTRKK